VVREGLELAVSLLATSFVIDGLNTVLGAVLGLSSAVLLGWLIFKFTSKLNIMGFFQVTNILLIYFAILGTQFLRVQNQELAVVPDLMPDQKN
jgi:high-affinity iron transporter